MATSIFQEAIPASRLLAVLQTVGDLPARHRYLPLIEELQGMRQVRLSGSPAEIGRRHGQVCAAGIRQIRRTFLRYLARITLASGALPLYGLFLWLARAFRSSVPPSLLNEMLEVARGAEVGPGLILLINVIDDLGNNSPRCSALAVGGEASADGAFLMGRNLDYPLFTDVMVELQTLFVLEPQGKVPVASVSWPGYVGVCTGLNRAGVALAQHSSMSRDRSLRGVPAALRFRHALESAHTALEVAALLLKMPGTIGNNVLLCDPREAVVAELSARRGACRHPQDGLLTVTNHYQSPEMTPLIGRFPPRPPFSPLTPYHFTEAYSRAREARLRELARGRRLGLGDLAAILADSKIANPGTVVSTIFAPGALTLWVARGEQPPVNHGPFEEMKVW